MSLEPTTEPLDTRHILRLRPHTLRPQAGADVLGVQDEWEAGLIDTGPVCARTIFLRGSECRFHCVMCDLWQFTHAEATPRFAIPQQIRQGILYSQEPSSRLPQPTWLKLYNASSFFDPKNVPIDDLPEVARLVSPFQRVIVENHPRVLPTEILSDFRKCLPGRLEIAMGLETVEPSVLARLNKQMQIEDFRYAADICHQLDIDVRAFVLLRPPWLSEAGALEWCQHSINYAIDSGARHVTIIPVRGGNGTLEWLAQRDEFEPPLAQSLEIILSANLCHSTAVVTADLWDWKSMRGVCEQCSAPRRNRLESMNLFRRNLPEIACEVCDAVK